MDGVEEKSKVCCVRGYVYLGLLDKISKLCKISLVDEKLS